MIKHPERRKNLIVYLEELASYPYETKNLNDKEFLVMDLEGIIHFFFDDTELADNTHGEIGWILISIEEADIIQILTKKIDFILDKYGLSLMDLEYVSKPEWQDVVKIAKEGLTKII